MVVAVDGTEPARVAGGRLPRLLRGALVAIGLSGLTWLLSLLMGTGTAAAETAPPAQSTVSTQPTGLLGGLVGTLGGVLNTATTAVGQLTGAVLSTVPPVVLPPPPAPESPPPQPEPVTIAKSAPARSSVHVIIPVERTAPAVVAPVRTPPPVAHKTVAHKPAVAPATVEVVHRTEPVGTERANPSGPDRAPGKTPTAPPAPAVLTGSVLSAHDGPGGTHGVLAGQAGIEPPAEAFIARGRAGTGADPAAGLPAASPD